MKLCFALLPFNKAMHDKHALLSMTAGKVSTSSDNADYWNFLLGNKGSFDFDESHGFAEVFEHVFSFFSDFVDSVVSFFVTGYEALVLQRLENAHERLPR
jgi:hypothetical protein